jgi:hypothetical protein
VHIASEQGHLSVLKTLLRHGGNEKLKSKRGTRVCIDYHVVSGCMVSVRHLHLLTLCIGSPIMLSERQVNLLGVSAERGQHG